MLQKKIENYEVIKDSGTHFEDKLFDNFYEDNYLGFEYFLRIENLNCGIKEFKDNFLKFKQKLKNERIVKELNKGASLDFRKNRSIHFHGGCFLDSHRLFILK